MAREKMVVDLLPEKLTQTLFQLRATSKVTTNPLRLIRRAKLLELFAWIRQFSPKDGT